MKTTEALAQKHQKHLLARISYAGNLTAQFRKAGGGPRNRVVYPVSADIMRAARIPGGTMPVIGHTLNWWDAPDEAEAAYLVAVLNAPCLEQAFAQSRESGRAFRPSSLAQGSSPPLRRRQPRPLPPCLPDGRC